MSVIFCILDGFALKEKNPNNAIFLAKMLNFRFLLKNSFWTTLDADGDLVGQEAGLVGNSEVGHMNLGGLRLIPQLSYQITKSAEKCFKINNEIAPDQKLDPNIFLTDYLNQNQKTNLHLVGLFSSGKVHSDTRHFIGSIKTGLNSGYQKIFLHLFTDGRDSDRQSFVSTLTSFVQDLKEHQIDISKIFISSIGGRFFAMDRDNNWQRVWQGIESNLAKEIINNEVFNYLKEKFDLQNLKNTENIQQTVSLANYKELIEYINYNYKQTIFDENVIPKSFDNLINKKDVVWIQNFRADRVRQYTQMLVELNKKFNWKIQILANNDYAVPNIKISDYIQVFVNQPVKNTFSEVIEQNNKSQLHIAETEKYNHVTYFFNGGQNKLSKKEEWKIIPSNKVEKHSEKPEMKAKEITDYIIDNGLNKYDYIVVNYANGDMVAHTGDLQATINSLEFLDSQIGRLINECQKNKHTLIITADHGNSEVVGYIKNENRVDTEHNSNPVPLIIFNIDKENLLKKLKNSKLAKNQDIEVFEKIVKSFNFKDDLNIQENWLNKISQPKLGLYFAGIVALASGYDKN